MACKGIDVSKYQGTIDWQRVAAEGIRFAFVRIGWAGYEGGIDEGADPYFDANMKGALAAGLAVGAYVYSYCRSANAARRAAREAAERCRPYRLTMPLALDIEDAATYKGIAKGDSSIIAAAFLDEAAAQGIIRCSTPIPALQTAISIWRSSRAMTCGWRITAGTWGSRGRASGSIRAPARWTASPAGWT